MLKKKESGIIIDAVNRTAGVLNLLKAASNTTDAEFKKKYVAPLICIADWVQELPASKLHHNEVGGALRFAIHSGFASMRLAESFIFTPSEKSEFRYTLEKEFRYAAYLATIFSTVAYPFSFLHVVNSDGEVWNKNTPLNLFASDSYELQWILNSQLDCKKGYFYASRILPINLVDGFDPLVVSELMKSLSPDSVPSGHESSMQKTVRLSIQKVIDLEKKRINQQFVESAIQPYVTEDVVIDNKPTEPHQSNTPKAPTVSDKASQETAISTDAMLVIKQLDKVIIEVLTLLKADIKDGKVSVDKIKRDPLGVLMPSTFFSKYGLPLTSVEGELRKKGMVVKKEGQTYILKKELGEWLIDGASNVSLDLFGSVE